MANSPEAFPRDSHSLVEVASQRCVTGRHSLEDQEWTLVDKLCLPIEVSPRYRGAPEFASNDLNAGRSAKSYPTQEESFGNIKNGTAVKGRSSRLSRISVITLSRGRADRVSWR